MFKRSEPAILTRVEFVSVVGACGFCGGSVLVGAKPSHVDRDQMALPSELPRCTRCGAQPEYLTMGDRRSGTARRSGERRRK